MASPGSMLARLECSAPAGGPKAAVALMQGSSSFTDSPTQAGLPGTRSHALSPLAAAALLSLEPVKAGLSGPSHAQQCGCLPASGGSIHKPGHPCGACSQDSQLAHWHPALALGSRPNLAPVSAASHELPQIRAAPG